MNSSYGNMKAVTFKDYGDASVLEINEIEKPTINEDEVLIKVAAAGINRPDILQRSGFYPPPKGASEILGLEVSGKVVEVRTPAGRWGDPDDLGGIAVFLSSDASNYVTGTAIPVDGGLSARNN